MNELTSKKLDLLPCPFCGGEASYEDIPLDRAVDEHRWGVGCRAEECIGFQWMKTYARKCDAAAEWNKRSAHEPRTDDGAAHANHASSPVGCATDAMGLHGNSRRQPEDFPSLAGDERPAAASSSPPPPDELLTAARDVVSIVRKTHDSEKWFTALAVLMRVVDERSTATKLPEQP